MALWNKIFGDDKKPRSRSAGAHAETEGASDEKDAPKASENAVVLSGKGASILLAPHTTEKATDLSERGAYVFRVAPGANKQRVAGAVAERYGVAVVAVRMINQPAKERRRGRQIGWKSGFKKAMVQLKEGQKIETL